MTTTLSPVSKTWIDMTVLVNEDAEIDPELTPKGTFEFAIPVPECPNSVITLIVPARVALKCAEKVKELAATLVPALLVTFTLS